MQLNTTHIMIISVLDRVKSHISLYITLILRINCWSEEPYNPINYFYSLKLKLTNLSVTELEPTRALTRFYSVKILIDVTRSLL